MNILKAIFPGFLTKQELKNRILFLAALLCKKGYKEGPKKPENTAYEYQNNAGALRLIVYFMQYKQEKPGYADLYRYSLQVYAPGWRLAVADWPACADAFVKTSRVEPGPDYSFDNVYRKARTTRWRLKATYEALLTLAKQELDELPQNWP